MQNNTDIAKNVERQQLSQLFESYPLYKKLPIQFKEAAPPLALPMGLQGLTFTAMCPTDGRQTFKLLAEPHNFIFEVFEKYGQDHNARALFDYMDQQESQYNYFQYYSACCQFCNKFKLHYLVHVFSKPDGTVYFTKVGQFPPYEITPDPELMRYLTDEDREHYKKALMCKSQNYGMGAYTYLRRIIQNEILRIVVDLSKIERPESDQIKTLLLNYEKDHQMEKLISAIGDYLPNSFKEVNDNPVKFLYKQLSGGIHEFTEDECSEFSESIDIVLRFVIKRLNEEASELKKVREALKSGRK